jgi:hypothetical protein
MSNRCARILAAGGTAVLVGALGVPAALAAATAKTWTVQPGGAITAMSGRFIFTDTKTGTVFYCVSSAASGRLKSGSGLPGFHAGSLSAVGFGQCVAPGGPQYHMQPGGLPWHVSISLYNAAEGVARGTLSHLHLTMSGNTCSGMIDGTSATADDGQVTYKYTDSTGQLRLTTGGNLHFYDVGGGCLGLASDGDPATLSVTYAVTPKQAITSP